MKFLLYLVIFILVGGVVCSKTLPGRDTHVRNVAVAIVDEIEEGNLFPGIKDTMFANKATDVGFVSECLDKVLVIDSYGVFNVGKIVWMNKEYVVSFGILGRVFGVSDAKAAEDFISNIEKAVEY